VPQTANDVCLREGWRGGEEGKVIPGFEEVNCTDKSFKFQKFV